MASARPSDLPSLGPWSWLVMKSILLWYRFAGWGVRGTLPDYPKMIVLGASHTSNWDFLVFVGTVNAVGRNIRFVGKNTLFRWPMGGFMSALGGVPVDRSLRQDLSKQIVDQFAAHDDFCLIIAAEGTRSYTEKWKTGFYHIAREAKVPIVCAGPDYPAKRGVFGPIIWPTGDFDRDMAPAYAFFRTLKPLHSDRAGFPPASEPVSEIHQTSA